MKIDGKPQEDARRLAWAFGVATVASIIIVGLFTPFLDAGYFDRAGLAGRASYVSRRCRSPSRA